MARQRLLSALVVLGMVSLAAELDSQEYPFKVVVNAGTSVSSMSTKEISQIFLKKTTSWPSGLTITPVNLPVDHPTREVFSQAIHGKGAHPVERRWETLIFSGMGVPPLKLDTEAEVVEFIKNNAGAIGYVAANTSLPREVTSLEIGK